MTAIPWAPVAPMTRRSFLEVVDMLALRCPISTMSF